MKAFYFTCSKSAFRNVSNSRADMTPNTEGKRESKGKKTNKLIQFPSTTAAERIMKIIY